MATTSHPAIRALYPGCDHLGLPRSAANELFRFLFCKRLVGDERGSMLSPSCKLDSLWHWVLLETDARDAVEALVGKVRHSQETAGQDDEIKMERRWVSRVKLDHLRGRRPFTAPLSEGTPC